MKHVIYIHGKGGSGAESKHYAPLFPGREVLGIEYSAASPWEAIEEFPALVPEDDYILIANSIGAYFAMHALSQTRIERAYFISPVVDMERLIADMMLWAGVTEAELSARGTIETPFGETLSWPYLCWVRAHPVKWEVPTKILYGERDNLTSMETITAFAKRIGAKLTVMPDGEHWFHTPEQMRFLDRWIEEEII